MEDVAHSGRRSEQFVAYVVGNKKDGRHIVRSTKKRERTNELDCILGVKE